MADEAPEAGNLSPEALGGTSVRLNLLVADPDEVAAVAIANGAVEVAPVADQSYGLRQGRLADPFGHHWLIGPPVAGAAATGADGRAVAEGCGSASLRGGHRADGIRRLEDPCSVRAGTDKACRSPRGAGRALRSRKQEGPQLIPYQRGAVSLGLR